MRAGPGPVKGRAANQHPRAGPGHKTDKRRPKQPKNVRITPKARVDTNPTNFEQRRRERCQPRQVVELRRIAACDIFGLGDDQDAAAGDHPFV